MRILLTHQGDDIAQWLTVTGLGLSHYFFYGTKAISLLSPHLVLYLGITLEQEQPYGPFGERIITLEQSLQLAQGYLYALIVVNPSGNGLQHILQFFDVNSLCPCL